jgi:hypothetical protein
VFGLVVIPLDLIGIARRMANAALLITVAIFPPKGSSAGPAGGLAAPISRTYPPGCYLTDASD